MPKWGVEYEPRIEDPVIVAKFDTKDEETAHLEYIKNVRPKASPYHTIVEIDDA